MPTAFLPSASCAVLFFTADIGILQHHQQRSRADQRAADQGFCRELLVQENEGEHQCNDDAELVDGHDLGCFAQLKGFVIAKPGRSGRKPGKNEEDPALL